MTEHKENFDILLVSHVLFCVKMSEVDEIKLEIKDLKERVDKLEDHIKNHEQHNHHSH